MSEQKGTWDSARQMSRNADFFIVRLSCNHTLRVRVAPFRDKQVYSCTMGMGCGYHLAWVEYKKQGTDVWEPNRGLDKP